MGRRAALGVEGRSDLDARVPDPGLPAVESQGAEPDCLRTAGPGVRSHRRARQALRLLHLVGLLRQRKRLARSCHQHVGAHGPRRQDRQQAVEGSQHSWPVRRWGADRHDGLRRARSLRRDVRLGRRNAGRAYGHRQHRHHRCGCRALALHLPRPQGCGGTGAVRDGRQQR